VSIPRLALAYLAARPLATALHVLLLALGVATMVLLLLFTSQAEERLTRDARPVDLVVGAKGSPLQLILSAVLHADIPTGNIPYDEARKVGANPMVAQAIPVSLGDSFRGYRIVGTEPAYLALYDARFASGRVFAAEMQAVLGAEVARRSGLGVGDRFVGSHGLSASGSAHASHPFIVTGVLAPTGTVIDRVVLTPLESVWEMHGGHATPGAPHEITALLVRYRTPIAAATLPRQVNATTVMQAASPALETARLMSLMGVGADALRLFAFVMMASAAASMLAALMAALHERRYDLALMRTLGARPSTLFALLACEGVTLVVAGVILGLALGHGAAEALGRWIARSNSWSITGFAWVPQELWLAVAVLAAGAATCLIPAIQAYRRDPAILLKR
jgi:putative ABC transport system permease protein